MITFKEFFVKEQTTIPRHRTIHGITTRGNKFNKDTGNLQSGNIMADKYKPTSPNFDQNSKQKTGIISPKEAEEIINKYQINRNTLLQGVPIRLRKREFALIQNPETKQFSIIKY